MNQKQHERIKKLVVDPLEAVYGGFSDDAVKFMVEDLKDYPDHTLSNAVREVRKTVKSFPKIAHIVEACKGSKAERADTSSAEAFYAQLQEKYQKAQQDAQEYTTHYMASGLALRANVDGWAKYLEKYVYCHASLQAHLITKLNAGYDSDALYNACYLRITEAHPEIGTERKKRELAFARKQSFINVEPLADMIAEWQVMEAWKTPAPVKSQMPSTVLTPAEKTKIDLEIERQLGAMAA